MNTKSHRVGSASGRRRRRQRKAMVRWLLSTFALALAVWGTALHRFQVLRGVLPVTAQEAVDGSAAVRPDPPLLEEARVVSGLEQRDEQMRAAREAFLNEASDWAPLGTAAASRGNGLRWRADRARPHLPRPGQAPVGLPAKLFD